MARIKKGVFSWEDVLAHRYQNNKPPPLPYPRHSSSPHTPQSQPKCAILTRLSPELRLIIWEMVLGGHRLHIIQRSGQRLGHIICPLCPEGGARIRSRSSPGPRSRLDFSNKITIARGVGDRDRDTFCEICQGAGIAQPVKEGDSWGFGVAGRNRNGLLGLVLTCRQMYGSTESLHLLYTKNTFEFSNPWSLPYLQPTIPPEYWSCIRAVELRWSFPGHWLPTKDPVRAIYVSAGRAQWEEGGGGYKVEEQEEGDLMEWRRRSRESTLDEEMSLSLGESRDSFESSSGSSRLMGSSTSSLRSEVLGSSCSSLESGGGMGLMGVGKGDADADIEVDGALATWELRLQGQSYYDHEVGQIGNDLWRKGIDCWISTV
ncbi:uncharacterized protein N7473_007619 [Penicillium subrubescens]|nr:uncharacterized protein N7473_007619 [Penicillium subrubescens]KAJ5891391.1 hypothetical protein N7473_007619 [Penicillium subrubescens]